jgi:capsular exopolysaccharide synthesis family protein
MTQHEPRFLPDPNSVSGQTTTPGRPEFRTLLLTLWRGKMIISAASVGAVVLTTYYVFAVATALYTSSVVVIFDTRQTSVVALPSVIAAVSGEPSSVTSEVEVLRARTLMTDVARHLNLMADPEFNADLREPGLKTRLRSGIESVFGGGRDFDLPATNDDRTQRDLDRIVNVLLSKVSVRNIPGSHVFRVSVTTQAPEKSALIADTIASQYIGSQMNEKQRATEHATKWLASRVVELQSQLEVAEAQVAQFTASTALISAPDLHLLERQLKDLRARAVAAQTRALKTQDMLGKLANAQTPQDKAAVADDVLLTQMLASGRPAFDNFAEFNERYSDIQSRVRIEAVRATQQLGALQSSATALERQIDQQGQDLISLQQLTREAAATRLLYEHFLSRLKETSAQKGIQQADSRVLSHAVVPSFADSPRKSLIITMAALFGLTCGALYVLVQEASNTVFRTAAELEAYSRLPVLGQITAFDSEPDLPARLKTASDIRHMEAMRGLRTSVLLANDDAQPQVILVTSPMPGEGKTTTALSMGDVLSGLDKRVLVIEGDVRRGRMRQRFKDLPEAGLVSVLNKTALIEDAIHRPAGYSADIMAANLTGKNAADLFASPRFGDLMQTLRAHYDYIVIDTPPVLAVPDACILAKFADTVLLTVKWDSTSDVQMRETLRLFRSTGVNVSGLVLTQISLKGMKRYGFGGKRSCYADYAAQVSPAS